MRKGPGPKGRSPYPKIELHVHLEGTVRPETLLELARRNDYALPCTTVDELRRLYDFRDFDHFLEVFELTVWALHTADDYRRIVVEYAAEAAAHGAVYIEAIFSPGILRDVDPDAIFSGCCDGAQDARERHGIEVRLTPDIPRVYSLGDALEAVRYATKYRERGVVGIGLGGPEVGHPPEPYAPAFELARAEGIASVPHAGEHDDTVRGALDTLGAVRIRHGIRAANDPELLRELADRGIVLDVCPISNLRTKAVSSLEAHPLPKLVGAGVACSISTDDPAMFGTDLTRDYDAASSLGLEPRLFYEAGLAGALCSDETKTRLASICESFVWPATTATLVAMTREQPDGAG
jgi:aminodeoxyfutalosine deaminase